MSLYTRDQEVYILSVPSGYIKVGISNNIERRIKQVQAECYEPVRYMCGTEISAASPVYPHMLEQLTHMKLRPFAGKRREWFYTTPEIAFDVLLTAYWFLAIPPNHPDIARVHPDLTSRQRGVQRRVRKGITELAVIGDVNRRMLSEKGAVAT